MNDFGLRPALPHNNSTNFDGTKIEEDNIT